MLEDGSGGNNGRANGQYRGHLVAIALVFGELCGVHCRDALRLSAVRRTFVERLLNICRMPRQMLVMFAMLVTAKGVQNADG